MRGYWAEIWRSPLRATCAGAILSALIASILYGFNWHTFYDTRTNFATIRSEIVAYDIQNLAEATNATPGNDTAFREAVKKYVAPRGQLITISRKSGSGDEIEWTESNNTPVDTTRTLVESEFILDPINGENSQSLQVNIKVGVRPRLIVALARAWSFSALDYFRDSEAWHNQNLINRSIPLYGYLLTIIIVGFGTIRALHKDQMELLRLEREGKDLEEELDLLRDEHKGQIGELEKQVEHSRRQRDDALEHRDQLTTEIAGIEREYQELIDLQDTAKSEDSRLKITAHRKSQVERVLASYNAKVSIYERELEETRAELGAAEQLMHEVESRREDLHYKLSDRNRQIRKLQSLIQETQKEVRSSQSEQLRSGRAQMLEIRKGEEIQETIEDQLDLWIRTGDHTNVNFSRHGKVSMVEEQFQKIDQAFVDRYFTHANNKEYERGARRLIRIITDGRVEGEPGKGELLIVLDDDAGRTIGMRYETRRKSPEPLLVGFALALLLRAKCRDFMGYAIRTR